MQRDLVVKGRSLGGCSDLTLLAPIKPGFVESLESVTYKTRIKRVLETLHGARMASHEHHTARLLSDAVERVGAIHSVRVAVLEPENKVLLAVTFDGSWESYIRVLWDKVGALLDLIFCGTVDYVTAHGHSFDEWLEWARRVQVETGFFYGPPESTARDALYQRRVEAMRVRGAGKNLDESELNEIRAVLPSAQDAVKRLLSNRRDLLPGVGSAQPATLPDDPQIDPLLDVRMVRERIRNGLQGLAALYRLVDLHRPSTPDGPVLRRAAIDLLDEFVRMHDDNLITDQLKEARSRFERQLDWLFPDDGPAIEDRERPAGAETAKPIGGADKRDIQGGIVQTYDNTTHGLLLMLAFDTTAVARDFFAWLGPHGKGHVTRASDEHDAKKEGGVFRNVSLTPAGLRAAGMDEDTLRLFPEEFLQGMAARAGLLGDVRNNHPRRWRLPPRFAGVDAEPNGTNQAGAVIELDAVHAVLQLRCWAGDDGKDAPRRAALRLADPNHPLRDEVARLQADNPGLRILAAQPLKRNYRNTAAGAEVIVEHFGYADGDGQPEVQVEGVAARMPLFDLNRIHPGELVLGHDNAADAALDLSGTDIPEAARARLRWTANGSFLVMRKYRQFVGQLQKAVLEAATEMEARHVAPLEECQKIVYAKLMGRWRDDGKPLVPGKAGSPNNFLYAGDSQGSLCPLQAHIRRAHPRLPRGAAARPPRLMRRSMSYGPTWDAGPPEADRGLVFMAYNASIGEQFEVVQRWLAGGNSTGASSATSCPIVGVPQNGLPRYFRFEHEGHAYRVEIDGKTPLFEEPQVPTRLEWGLYLFTPSIGALTRLRTLASTAAAGTPTVAVPWQPPRGRQLLASLLQLEAGADPDAAVTAWKNAIEDPESIDRLDAAALWATIREDHGGVLKTAYGTLVADRELISQVLLDTHARYSVCGQLERMKRSFGQISLGLDASPAYEQQSAPINAAIAALTRQGTFNLAFVAARNKIDAIVAEAIKQSRDALDRRFEVGVDAREVADEALAVLCEAWFGLQDETGGESTQRLRRGGVDWAWKPGQKPPYPGHYTAISRYMFQPVPGPAVVELGESYGQALRDQMRCFVADQRARGTTPRQPVVEGVLDGTQPAPIALAAFDHEFGADDDFVARTMVGVLMGLVPTIAGAVLNVLREWQREGRFGALRVALAGALDFAGVAERLDGCAARHAPPSQALLECFVAAQDVLGQAMSAAARMRPMPQLGWRTALKPHRLGTNAADAVDVAAGDKIVLGIVSGTQQSLGDGQPDGRLMFGGDRSAKPHPTHACPGYEAAIGAMLGILTALLARPESLRQGASALTCVVEGSTPPLSRRAPAPAPAPAPAKAVAPDKGTLREPSAKSRDGLVLGWGDSWLDYRALLVGDLGQDLRDCLQSFGYTVPTDFCTWTTWPKATTMAAAPEKFVVFLRDQLQTSSVPLRAVVLSAGGNDSTQSTLENLLRCKGAADGVLDKDALGKHIDSLHQAYRTMLTAIRKALDASIELHVPVIVHGYDHPFPVGRQGVTKWLYEPFKNKGYDPRNDAADKLAAVGAMRDLINALNDRLGQLPAEFAPTGLTVRYVDLRGTIAGLWTDAENGWDNDLHPTSTAFKQFAIKLDDAI